MPERRLVLEIEVPDFNVDGIAEMCERESEPDALYTVREFLLDSGLITGALALGIYSPTTGIEARVGILVGARIAEEPTDA